MKILLVDDDQELLDMITYAFRRKGHTIYGAAHGEEALQIWQEFMPSVVILDVALPRMNGLDVCKRIRSESDVPIMLVSGATDEDDVIAGLEAGADEYIFKPFSMAQLSLRLQALFRRTKSSVANDYQGALCVADLEINPEYCSVRKGSDEVRLTRMEFRVLYCLAANAGRVVLTDKLADFAWQCEGEGDPALLKTHISRLRRKLGLRSDEPPSIQAIPGVGYSLTAS